ncbi:hypothetical protein GE061_014508 [Apolygus lucorum]|uniref:Aldehyde dehydrogenase domain-containing protein n=1 Tax=Apolygus lucorum TaxID=248454 RepID=A0A8S9XKI6_APOLU|nr:hypothetical protein GE061_014508 [Apolygus lucorum]
MFKSLRILPKQLQIRSQSNLPQPLRNPKLPPGKLFINNEWVDASSGKTFTVRNPANEQVVTELALADRGDVDAAVAAAKEAFKMGSAWRTMDASQRGFLINKLADLMDRDINLLASFEALECGKVFLPTLKGDIQWAIRNFRYYAGYADKNNGATTSVDGNFIAFSRHEPVGVVGNIVAWNFATLILAWKMAPSLAAGCTTVIKPSQYSSLATLHVGELVKEAGFPPGVVNILTGPGKIGASIVDHPDVDCISFTGSTPVGKEIYRKGADNMKRLVLELGGKSPNIILKDADVDKAVEHAHFASFHNMGQCCCAGSRTFVHESMYDEFVEKMKRRIANRKIGDPFDLDVDHGPQTTKEQADIVMRYIELGKKEGATCEVGGNRIERPGYYVQPTMFTNVTDNMTIAKEEIFGPVMQVLRYKTIDEVIERANDTEFGLASSVFGSNIDDINTLVQGIRAGSVWVNCYFMITPQSPFGGYKMSGIGREGGSYGIHAFSEMKSVYIKTPTKNS